MTDWVKYYADNREKRLEQSRKSYQKRKDTIKLERKIAWDQLTEQEKDEVREVRKEYYQKNKVKYLKRSALQYKKLKNALNKEEKG
jgi:arylsulfatase A-like enzyme